VIDREQPWALLARSLADGGSATCSSRVARLSASRAAFPEREAWQVAEVFAEALRLNEGVIAVPAPSVHCDIVRAL
jgi:hypothetical protein